MKILDSNINKKWTGKGLSSDKNTLIAYKNANFRQNINLTKGEYTLKFLGKVRTGSGPINIKISTDRNINIFNCKLTFGKSWSEEIVYFDLNENYGLGYITISRDDASYGSIEIGRILLEKNEIVELPIAKNASVVYPKIDYDTFEQKSVFRKNIGFIIPYSIYGGAEVYLSTLINGLDKNVFNVHILYIKNNPLQYSITNNFVNHKEIGNFDNLVNHLKNITFDYLIYYNSIQIYQMINKAIDIVPKNTKLVEIYHSNFKWSDSLSSLSERRKTKILFKIADSLAENITGIDKKILLPVPIDLEKFSFRTKTAAKLNFPDDGAKIIGIVARLSKEKNLDYVLDLAKETTNLRFVIFGDGPEESKLKIRISTEKISNVHLLGFKKDVHNYYYLFDGLLLCSHMEGTPISILEAMASGVPVFTTPVGNIPDIITDQKTGFFLTKNAKIDAKIILDNLNSQNVVLAARNYIEEIHDKEKIISKFSSTLLDLDNKFIKRDGIRILEGDYI